MTELITSISERFQFQDMLNLLEILLVVTALLITTSETVRQAITYYQWQSVLLAIVTTATAIFRTSNVAGQSATDVGILILFIALLPAILAVAIRPLLHRATLERGAGSTADDLKMILASVLGPLMEWFDKLSTRLGMKVSWTSRIMTRFRGRVAIRLQRYRTLEKDAEVEWQRRQTMQKGLGSLLLFPLLLLVAFLIPFAIKTTNFNSSERIGLAVSLALHLIGLYNMVIKRDIISQVIGLLIMDHGLYLAVVKIVEIPVPAGFFVLSLYFYTLITIFILVILLPQIRVKTNSIDLAEIAKNSDLRSKTGS